MVTANVMAIDLYEHQKIALEKLNNGSILKGGVGSGKSRTSLAYYFIKECNGKIKTNGEGGYSAMKNPKDLYIITTARKRDTLDWEKECVPFLLSTNKDICDVKVVVDSWNNISKYVDVKNAFFIFDEQRLVGSGAWVKSFLKITKSNNWILLTATPGDTWMEYIPVFIANGFYKNRTQFIREHVVYNRFSKFPKVDRYVNCDKLVKYKQKISVDMQYKKQTTAFNENVIVDYDKEKFDSVLIKRWNIFDECPVRDISQLCFLLRKVVNSDKSRSDAIKSILQNHKKIIVFYNFNYELDILRELCESLKISYAEWNGQKHEMVPTDSEWIYLVQYTAGAEGWNCIETNTIVFYSQNYSYKILTQAAGRIDRLNTPYSELYYYHLKSNSIIDMAISKAISKKKDFNEYRFMDV